MDNIAMSFQKCFDTGDGKVVLDRLSVFCKENTPTYVDGNTHGTAYKEGQRSVILHIRRMLAKDAHKEQLKESINDRDN